jgi:hypothetical protein
LCTFCAPRPEEGAAGASPDGWSPARSSVSASHPGGLRHPARRAACRTSRDGEGASRAAFAGSGKRRRKPVGQFRRSTSTGLELA